MIESGGDEFSIRNLAGRCGYTAPTIYHYFGDKEGLVAALLEERFARLLATVRTVDLGPDPVTNLQRMIGGFLRFGDENPTFYRLIVAGSRRGGDPCVRAGPGPRFAIRPDPEKGQCARAAG